MEDAEARIVLLADVWLDRPDTLESLHRVLSGACHHCFKSSSGLAVDADLGLETVPDEMLGFSVVANSCKVCPAWRDVSEMKVVGFCPFSEEKVKLSTR